MELFGHERLASKKEYKSQAICYLSIASNLGNKYKKL
jgi:hypothetical protein